MSRLSQAVQAAAAVAVVVLGTVMLFTPTAASATSARPSSSPASTCPIDVGGHRGYYICEYGYTYVTWPDGHHQYFVVGTDYAVYDTYQLSPGSLSWSNWRNLGGVARSGVDVLELTSNKITISVWGTYNGWWCKTWTSSSGWGGWRDC